MPKNDAKLSVGFLFDDTLDSNDGVAQYVKTLGAWLSGRGHNVSYLVGESKTTTWAGGAVYSLAKNVGVAFNGNHLSMPLPAKRTAIRRVLSKNEFDVLHVQVPYSPFMAQRVIGCADDSTAVVGTFHIYPAGRLARVGSRLLRVLYGGSLRRVRPVLAVSPAAAGFAKEAYKINTIPSSNVVDLEKFKLAKAVKSDVPQIVFLGRLVERKGCQQLLAAFALLHRQMPDAHLTIAGDGPQRQKLERFVSGHKLTKCVTFLGYIDEQDKPNILAGADVACFPSLHGESFGIVLIEAMAAGAGVVLGGNNAGYKTVLGAQPKMLVDPTDAKAFARRLQELLTDKALAATLHEWQVNEVKRYDINSVGPKILAVYQEAIANQRSNGHN